MTAPTVLVCGIQHSGNKLLCRLLLHHGARASIYHGTLTDKIKAKRWRLKEFLSLPGPSFVVVPIRDGLCNQESLARTSLDLNVGYGMPRDYAGRVQRHYQALKELGGIPMMVVPYERLVKDPGPWGQRVVEFCGLEWRGWPEKVFDANEKYGDRVARQPGRSDA